MKKIILVLVSVLLVGCGGSNSGGEIVDSASYTKYGNIQSLENTIIDIDGHLAFVNSDSYSSDGLFVKGEYNTPYQVDLCGIADDVDFMYVCVRVMDTGVVDAYVFNVDDNNNITGGYARRDSENSLFSESITIAGVLYQE